MGRKSAFTPLRTTLRGAEPPMERRAGLQPAVTGGGAKRVAINERDQTPDAIHSGLKPKLL